MSDLLSPSFGRLLWKEWRIARPFTIAMFAIGVLILALAAVQFSQGYQFSQSASAIVPGCALVFVVAALATGFAAENENRTLSFQRSLPIGVLPVVLSKIIVALVLAGLLSMALAFVALLINFDAMSETEYGTRLLAFADLAAWGTLVSMLMRRPLAALIVASLLALATAFTCTWLADSPFDHSLFIAYRLLATAVVVLAATFVAKPWFQGTSTELIPRLLSWRSTDQTAQATRSVHARTGTISMLGRIVWTQYRSHRWVYFPVVAAMFLIGCRNFFILRLSFETQIWSWSLLMISSAVLGSLVFAVSDDERRFLSSLSLRPAMAWLGCLILPGVLVAGITLFMAVSLNYYLSRFTFSEPEPYWPGVLGSISLGGPFAVFAAAQLTSQWAKTTITSFGLAIGAGALTAAAVWFLALMGVPLWVVVLPGILFALASTLWRSRGWLRDWHDRRFMAGSIATIAIPVMLVLVGLATFRALELPTVDPARLAMIPTPVSGFISTAADPLRALAEEAEEARFDWLMRDSKISETGEWIPLTEDQRNWLDQVKAVFGEDELPAQSKSSSRYESQIAFVLGVNINPAILVGRSEEAQESLELLIRQTGLGSLGYSGTGYGMAIAWAVTKETRPEQIKEVIDLIAATIVDPDDLDQAIAREAFFLRAMASFDTEMLDSWYGVGSLQAMGRVQRWMPWETVRTNRYLDRLSVDMAEQAEVVKRAVSRNGRPRLNILQDARPSLLISPWINRRPIVFEFIRRLRNERATLVRLAVIHWQKTHDGAFPANLDAIASLLPENAVIDPFQGLPFVYWLGPSSSDSFSDSLLAWKSRPVWQFPMLWSPSFVIEPDTLAPADEPRFYLDEAHEGRSYRIDTLTRQGLTLLRTGSVDSNWRPIRVLLDHHLGYSGIEQFLLPTAEAE